MSCELDAPVVDYWPEFGAEGKAATTVRDLLSHRAGLAAFDERISIEDFIAWDPAVERLAAQAPNWEPGTAHGYHALTFGHLVGEVVRRATGRTLGRYFADEVAAPARARLPHRAPARARAPRGAPLRLRRPAPSLAHRRRHRLGRGRGARRPGRPGPAAPP